MSGWSSNCCTDFFEQEATSSLDTSGKEGMSADWTDEKHSLYLKSMEASFVEQLYNSISLIGSRWQNGHDSGLGSSSKYINPRTAGQFKVHQNGSWQKLNFARDEDHTEDADEHQFLVGNPWIRHFRSEDRQDVPFTKPKGSTRFKSQLGGHGIKESKGGLPNMSKQFATCWGHQESLYNQEAEASDQNFVDEDDEEDGKDDDDAHRTKRLKTCDSAASDGDRVDACKALVENLI